MLAAAVVDASVAVKWVVEEVGSEKAVALKGSSLVAPDLILVECSNILWKKVRRRELTKKQATDALDQLMRAQIQLAALRDLVAGAHRLALEIDHPSYDCIYLALADRERVPLITAGKRLVNVVRQHRKHADRVVLLGEL